VYKALSTGAIGVRVPFEEQVRLASAHGFEGVSVEKANVDRLGMAEIRALLARFNQRPAVTGIPVNFREDDATFQRDMAGLSEWAKVMSDLGCTRSATWIMPTLMEGVTFETAYGQLRSRTADICAVLAPYGIQYGLEFVGPKTMREGKTPFLYDQTGMLGLIRDTGAANLGLLLDCFHWYTSHGTVEDLGKLNDSLITLVHVNDATAGRSPDEQIDSQRALPGATGVIDSAGFMGALKKMDYSGPVVVEPFCPWLSDLSPDEAVAKVAEALDSIWIS